MGEDRKNLMWRPAASIDLDCIWDYYVGVAGKHTAEKMLREISATCAVLKNHSLAGRARDEVQLGLRSAIAGRHVIFYLVTQEVIEIVRVLDGRQDTNSLDF